MKLFQEAVEAISMEPTMKAKIKEDEMEESIKKLRFDFEAETDIVVDKSPEDWQRYAIWLEGLMVNELNNQMVKENVVLKDMMQEALVLLQEGIVKRVD